MDQIEPSAEEQVAAFIASAAKQPLLDAAFELWRWRYRLDSIEGRPTADEVRVNRTLTPEQLRAKCRYDRDHAHEGPMFGYLKRAHPHAGNDAIRQAIITSVKFEDATFAHFEWNGDFWECVRARGGSGCRRVSPLPRDHLSRRPQQRGLLLQVS